MDDNGDGRVDEGFTYEEIAGTRHVVDAQPYSGIFWASRGPNTAILTWMQGNGTPIDTVKVQVLDLVGNPVAAARSFGTFQASNTNAAVWMNDRYFLAGTTRHYDCGGTSSTTCKTYGFSVLEDGVTTWGPTQLFADTPWVSGHAVIDGEYWLVTAPVGSTQVRLRSFTSAGLGGSVDRTLLTLGAGDSAHDFRAVQGDGKVVWTFELTPSGSTLPVARMFVTDQAGVVTLAPVALSPTVRIATSRTSPPHVVVDDTVYVAMADGTMARWSVQGAFLGSTSLGLGAAPSFVVPTIDGRQVLFCAQDGTGVRLGRLSFTGDLVQPPTSVISEATFGCAVVAVPTGVVVAGAVYTPGKIFWSRAGCP
jgi:hypothetical protein